MISLLTEESTREVIDRTLADLDLPELVAGLAQAPALCTAALTRRPEILAQPEFWTHLDSISEAFRAAKGWKVEVTLSALMLAGRHDLAPDAVHEFGSTSTLRALKAVWDRSPAEVGAWLQPSTGDVGAVAEFLVGVSTIPRLMMYRLARVLAPEAVPNDYGKDPWLIAERNAVGGIDDTDATYLHAYLLSRAFYSANPVRRGARTTQLREYPCCPSKQRTRLRRLATFRITFAVVYHMVGMGSLFSAS